MDNGGCGGLHCINRSGRALCGCKSGYKLSASRHTCEGKKVVIMARLLLPVAVRRPVAPATSSRTHQPRFPILQIMMSVKSIMVGVNMTVRTLKGDFRVPVDRGMCLKAPFAKVTT